MTEANPNLSVTLKFDHTCPLWKVRQIMKPDIPVANLFLETFTMIYPELEIATDSYSNTLRKGTKQGKSPWAEQVHWEGKSEK